MTSSLLAFGLAGGGQVLSPSGLHLFHVITAVLEIDPLI